MQQDQSINTNAADGLIIDPICGSYGDSADGLISDAFYESYGDPVHEFNIDPIYGSHGDPACGSNIDPGIVNNIIISLISIIMIIMKEPHIDIKIGKIHIFKRTEKEKGYGKKV